MKVIITYGTFDLLHYGHIRLLKRARELGDYLIVGLSTDEFNETKGKTSYYNYEIRKEMLEALKYVDKVIPEKNWEQKPGDIQKYKVDTLVMGSDWENSDRFTYLQEYCNLTFLSRTHGISSTLLKGNLIKEESKETATV